jgi:hypothetical protein
MAEIIPTLKAYFFCGGTIYGVKEEMIDFPKKPLIPIVSLRALESMAKVHQRAPVNAVVIRR